MNIIHILLRELAVLRNFKRILGIVLFLSVANTTTLLAQCPTPGLTISSTNSTCFNSDDATMTITVDNPNGYAGNYEYQIFGIPPVGPFIFQSFTTSTTTYTFTGLEPANYIFVGVNIVDDGSCAALSSGGPNITEPAQISLSATTQTDCDLLGTGSIDLTVSGGTAPYVRYTWTGGLPDQEDHIGTVSAGSYDVEVEDSNGCTMVLTNIVVDGPPDATITPVAAVCANDAAFNMAAATPGGTWSGTGIIDAVNGTFDPAVAGAGIHTITYSVTDGSGCNSIDTEDVTVNAIPDATITPVAPVCVDAAAFNLTAATPGGTWSGTGITDGVNGTFDPAVAGAGVHTITYQLTDGNGCTGIDTEDVTVNPLPDATITPPGPVCMNDAAFNLTAATAGGTWSGTGITDAVNGTFDPAVAGLGIHTITYDVTDGNGCTNSDTEDITVNALPDATITAVAPVCVDDAAFNLTAATPGGTWSGTGIVDAVNGTFDPAIAGPGVHTITYQVTDGNGCTNSDTEDITVNALPDATITPVAPVCIDAAAFNLTAATVGGTWSGTGITDAVNGTFDAAVAGVGVHTITYQITDGNGCTGVDTEDITVNALPDATITPAGPVCVNDAAFNLTAATAGGTWSGTGITDGVNGTFDPAIAGPGVHTITYQVTDGNGCTNSDTEDITVNALPDATITAVAPVCVNAAAFNLTAATAGGTWSGTGITDGVNGTFDPAVAGIGIHTITYQVTDGNGCTGTDTEDITVNALPDATITPVGPVCVNDAAFNLTAATAGGTWSGTGITDGVNGTFDPVVAGVGVHTITYQVTDGSGCTGTDTEDITVNALPDATITPAGPVCVNDAAFNLMAATAGGTWSGTGITDAVNGTFDPTVAGIGVHTITYQVTDGNGCTNSDTEDITVNSLPDATITPEVPVCVDAAAFNLTAATVGGTWSGTGITDAVNGTFDPAIAGPGVHTITYQVTDGNGCTGTDTEDITVNALPDATITPVPPVCVDGAAFNLTAATAGGTWSGTGITDAVNGTFDPAVAGIGVHTITYQITDGNGCTGTDTEDIAVNALPDATITAVAPVCINDAAFNLTAATAGGTWSGTGITDAVNGTFDPAVAGIGVHTITYQVTDGNGCTNSDTEDITVNTLPDASITPAGPACIDSAPFNLTAATAGGTWSGTGITDAVNGTFDPAIAGAGTHTITYDVTDGNGCTGTDTEDITVNPLPDPGVDNTIDVCEDDAAVDLFAALAGTPQAGGIWNDDDASGGLTGATFDATVGTVVAGNSYDFTYTVSNPGCAPLSATVTVNVVAGPNPGIGSAGTACITTTNFDLYSLLSAFDAGGSWNDDDLTFALSGPDNEIFDASAVAPGNTYNFTYIVSNPTCGATGTTVSVNVVNSLNAGTANANNFACDYDNAYDLFNGLTGNDPGGSWNDDDGTGALTGNLFDATAVVPGTYLFTYTVSAAGCTDDTEQISVEVTGAPVADAGVDQAVCADNTFLAATLGVNETGIWTVVAGTGVFVDNTDPNTQVNGLSAGVNTFQWEVTSTITGCAATDQTDVNFTQLTVADAGFDQTVCTNVVTLAANAFNPAIELGFWSYAGPVIPAPVFIDPNDPNTQVTGLIDGENYDFTWSISDINPFGCGSSSDVVNIDVIGTITVADAGPDQNLCVDFSTLAANAVAGGETGTWTVISGSGIFADANDPGTDVSGLSVGINEFQWAISDNSGTCPPSNDIVTISVGANSVADAGPDQDICTSVTTLAANAVGFNETGTWTIVSGTGLFADANDPATSVSGLSAGINVFRWTIVDNGGVCPTTQSDVTVDVTGSMTASDAGPDQNICLDFTTLAANTVAVGETGTWFVISGSAAFVDVNDPNTNVSGLAPGLNELQWQITDNLGTCTPSNDIVDITVSGTTVANAGSDQNICNGFTTLAANAAGVDETGTWTIISGTGSFADINDPATTVTGLSIGINQFRWTITDDFAVCTATQDDISVNVLNPTDPLCTGGGGINCGAFTINIVENRPTCINNDDGVISFNITGGSGNYTVLLTDNNGFNKGETGSFLASIDFEDLTAADYEYTVDDGAGNICTLPYSLVRATTVEATATNFVDVTCFGESTGQAEITIVSGGNAPYEYSIDGLVWDNLPPNRILNDLPPYGSYNILIRNDAADQCPAQVPVVINNASTQINLTYTTTEATCFSAGGTIVVTNVSGGVAPYSYRLDGTTFSQLPANDTFEDLTAGIHELVVIDDNGCERPYNIIVNAPGLVLFNVTPTNPDCANNGQNGTITVQIDPSQLPGAFEAAISQNINEDGEFITIPPNGLYTFLDLSVGNYFVTVTSGGGCPNKIPVNITTGPTALDFDLQVECFENQQALLLTNITAEDDTPFDLEIYRVGAINPVDVITLSDIPAGRIFRITNANFLNGPDTYQIQMTQSQSSCSNTLTSGVTNFVIREALNATLGAIEVSFPERPTGSIWINNVHGGLEDYYLFIEPGGTDWIEIPKNNTIQEFEYQITELFPGDYEIYIADSLGCEIVLNAEVPQDTEVFIPNIFTPNGDSYNDTFFIRNMPLDGTKLFISNRLGRKIYENDNYQNDWDGEGNADGIYFYNIEIGEEKYSGWVELWRGGMTK